MRGIKRKTGFLAAAISLRKAIIGDIGRAMGSIPVERPQDVKFIGEGKISLSGTNIQGNEKTKFFKQLSEGASVCIGGLTLLVASVESDTKATLKKPLEKGDIPQGDYKIIPKLDQEEVFSTVASKLIAGEAIGIFPEGGSHDRTDLLPLKAGVTIMALTALEMNPNLPLKIIPCGLNYFHGHRFRSEAYLDIGEPILVTPGMLEKFKRDKEGKREACNELLSVIKESIKLVTTQAPNYESLRIFWTLRVRSEFFFVSINSSFDLILSY